MNNFNRINHFQSYLCLLRTSISLRSISLRKHLLKLSKKKIELKYNIKESLVSKLENNENHNLSSDDLNKLFSCYSTELSNINLDNHFTYEFFISGKGLIPEFYVDIVFHYYIDYENIDESLIKDVELMQKRYKNSSVLMVQDDSNVPYFSYGDYVVYVWRNSKHIESLKKTPCVVEVDDRIIIRICSKIENKKFLLETINPYNSKKYTLEKIAPIINTFYSKKYRIFSM